MDQKRRLTEQKIKLIESLVNSPAARAAASSSESAPTALVEKGRQALDAARTALADNRIEEAAQLADEALRSVSAASRRLAPQSGGLSESAQRKTYRDLSEQLAAYRASVVDLGRGSGSAAAAHALLARIDAQTTEAKALAAADRVGDANKKLAEAYKSTVEEIAKLRAGQDVVLTLKFDTPADEFAYEQRRFSSNEIMVDMMIGEGRADGERRKLVDGFIGQGRKLKDGAESRARSGNYTDAVELMERANGQLNRALQAMGLPVF